MVGCYLRYGYLADSCYLVFASVCLPLGLWVVCLFVGLVFRFWVRCWLRGVRCLFGVVC